jgi:L-iditol 2-dehydrogenase
MIAAGTLKVDPLITAVAPLGEGAKWFRRLYRNEKGLLKVILEPSNPFKRGEHEP